MGSRRSSNVDDGSSSLSNSFSLSKFSFGTGLEGSMDPDDELLF